MNNLSELFVDRSERSTDQRFGLVQDHEPFGDAFNRAATLAALLIDLGVSPGQCAAVIGTNSRDYLCAWMALQLAGAETAMVNPTYPAELLSEMLVDLQPQHVVWVGPKPNQKICPSAAHIDAARAASGVVASGNIEYKTPASYERLPGLDRELEDIAGYMHTSGTTGTPKFCVQTHGYFLRLGRFIADSMALSELDTVLAPLPLFHINPLGYGVVGGLLAGASVLSAERFSASRFWEDVRTEHVTALILHGPPVEILKRSGRRTDSTGHRVRIVFFADDGFMDEFEIPLGISGYGSTETGGLCHVWMWRRGDTMNVPEGSSHYGGNGRADVSWRVAEDGEILVRGQRGGVLFEGYRKQGEIVTALDKDGWFATGDVGRVDSLGSLIFIERRAESIRVKGEYVPISFVEEHFAKVPGLEDVAVWRQSNELGDHEVTLFVTGTAIDLETIQAARLELPTFMRPTVVVHVKEIPRDKGIGKVRRWQLPDAEPIETTMLV